MNQTKPAASLKWVLRRLQLLQFFWTFYSANIRIATANEGFIVFFFLTKDNKPVKEQVDTEMHHL